MTYLQACQSMPNTQQATGNSYLIGFFWAGGYVWNWINGCYNHFNTPNKLTCNSSGGGGFANGMSPPTSNHPGGVNMCFADGHVQFIKDSRHWPPSSAGSRAPGTEADVVSSDPVLRRVTRIKIS